MGDGDGGRAPPPPVGLALAAPPDRPGVALVPVALSAAALAIALGYFPSLDAPFVEPKLAVLCLAGALGLGGQLLASADGRRRPRWPWTLTAAVAALLLTTLLSALAAARRGPPGAPYAAAELVRLVAVIGVALGAAAASATETTQGGRRRLCEAIHAGAALVSLLGLLQHFRILPFPIPTISVPGSTFGNRNVASEAVAAAIPFGLALFPFDDRPRRADAIVGTIDLWAPLALALALELGYLAVARTRGAWLGGGLGIAVFFALRRPRLPRAAVAGTIAIGAAVVLAAMVPGRWTAHDSRDAKRFAPGGHVLREAIDPRSPVARTRIGLWRRTLQMYREHPLSGVGPGNFAVAFPRYAEPGATEDAVLSPTEVPRRAHDDLLERLAETGPLGLGALLAVYLVAGGLAIAAARRARQEGRSADSSVAAAGAASLAAVAGSGLTGFPLAMPATAFLFGVALGLLAAGAAGAAGTQDERPPGAARRRAGAWLMAALLVAGAGWWSARRLAASYALARAEAALRADDSPESAARALPFLARAAAAQPTDFMIALRTAYAESRAGHPAESAQAALRALAIEPDSANAWEALARARLDSGDPRAAADAATHALAILHDYPAALYLRARAADRLGDAGAAAADRARLIDLAATNPEAKHLAAALAAGAR
jgi:O-antigen ligase